MKRIGTTAVLAGLAVVAVVCQDASARNRMYNPAVGRFMQRDPAGTMVVAPAMARNLSGSAYTQRDPTEQYRDGMNLYQYGQSSPIRFVDPEGLFGIETHFDAVKNLAHRACPAIEDAVANASQGMDEGFHDAPAIVILGWLTLGLNTLRPEVQKDYEYHFPGAGPPLPGQQVVQKGWTNPTVMALYKRVTNKNDPIGCDPAEFGKFLHMLADSFSHGGGVPDMFGHPKGVPIYGLVNDKGQPLKHHFDKDGHLVLDEKPVLGADGTFKGVWSKNGGWWDTSVDDPVKNWKAWKEAVDAMRSAMKAFKSACPCACVGSAKDK